MSRPKVSIIVAVYNTAKYLEKCLNQVQNQTLKKSDYEVIVVNDCSTDNSAEIIDRFAAHSENMKVIHKQENEGTFWSRVDGMKAAEGEYIGFVDSDDWIEEGMYEALMYAAMEQGADIVECGYQDEDEAACEIHYQLREGKYTCKQIVNFYTKRIINASLWMRLYRRGLVDKILQETVNSMSRNEYKGIRNEDEFLFPLLLNEAEVYYAVHLAPYHYRIDSSGSIMSEIQEDVKKKVFHCRTVIRAGQLILDKTAMRRELWPFYLYMQTNNLFYLLGVIKKNCLIAEEYKKIYIDYFSRYFNVSRLVRHNILYGVQVILRNLHLYVAYKRHIRGKKDAF